MKTVKITEAKGCDFCEKEAEYDAPTIMDSWANMCQKCFDKYKGSNYGAGFKLVVRKPAEKSEDTAVYTAIELTDLGDIVLSDVDREVECPQCGEVRTVEPDADYEFQCGGCGVKLKVVSEF